MEIRSLTPRYFVAPQLAPEHMEPIARAGFTTVICNRPDSEVPQELQSKALREAAEAAGLKFEVLELTHQTLTPENADRQDEMIENGGDKVLAYCRTGTRSSVIWGVARLKEWPVEEVMLQTAAAGYKLDCYLALFEQVATHRS